MMMPDRREKGFDSKWVAADNKKSSSWQEVPITSKKKNLSAAEKKAKTQKISAQVLKNADSVQVRAPFDSCFHTPFHSRLLQVHLDGERLLELVEKRAAKDARGPGDVVSGLD
jgi:hypothetical protein